DVDEAIEDIVEPDGTPDVATAPPDVGPSVDVSAPPEDVVEPDPSGAPVDLNTGWIGGPCPDDLACDYESGTCLLDTEGFPDGHCTQPCDLYCPDQAGAATTFCVNPGDLGIEASGGWCVMQCDFGMSPTGCRSGYYCGAVERYGEPETVKFACLPGEAPDVEMSDCMLELIERGVGFHVGVNPMDSPDGHPDLVCDVHDPVWVDGTLAGVNYRYASTDGEVKRMFAACELALAMHDTATLVATEGVTDIVHLGVYNCRVISGTSTLSQHAFANAIDIAGFQLDTGAYWTVFDDWEDGVADPLTESGDWLLWFANELYVQWIFNIILTPEYNAAHDDHFHCDLTPGSHSLH
ncbi:MAG: extensin family protein, partial [Myxococcota bacterium]|nr:extensin family protein [Myxococcota bacterium]